MPVKPNVLERFVVHRLNRAPGAFLDLFSAAGLRVATLAIETGIFEALADGHERSAAIADATDTHPDGVRYLLAYLEPLGYVRETADGYANSAMTARWLVGEDSVAPWLVYWQDLVFEYWDEHLETVLREGEPPQTMYEWLDDHGGWERTQRGFRAVATLLVDDVFAAVTLPDGDATLLDVGGGHGYYTIEACRRQPDLTATLLDAPDALGLAREAVADAGLDDRVTLRSGDALTDDVGSDYDLIFCFNVAHGFDPATNRDLFARLRDALAPGGRLVVLDQFEGQSRLSMARAGLELARLVYETALNGTVYEVDQYREWLRDAGFTDVSVTRFRTMPGIGLLEATG
jgi:SAM-dependent methyltransferase